MKSHNINPHSGTNRPEFSQVHGRALLGGTVQVRAPGSRVAKKNPIKMTRKPIPPRIAPEKTGMPQKEKDKMDNERLQVVPQTFEKVQARQLQILPPSFNEKNLNTKTQKVEEADVGIVAKKGLAKTETIGLGESSAVFGNRVEETNDSSAGNSTRKSSDRM